MFIDLFLNRRSIEIKGRLPEIAHAVKEFYIVNS